jgi:glutaminase
MNRALGYLMRNAGSLRADVDETLDTYFRQCALNVTTDDLAVMAATLANGGVNPRTGREVVSPEVASSVLTVMSTCGMYDASGEWLLRVGLPAKSGVSGALVAVKPGQFGLGLCSPLVDAQGNSVRAVAACRDLAERFGLHLLNDFGPPAPLLWLDGDERDWPSSKHREERERRLMDRHGNRIQVRGLQGEIGFAAAERAIAALADQTRHRKLHRWLVLDVSRVSRMRPVAVAMLEALAGEIAEGGSTTVVTADSLQRGLLRGPREFRSLDAALESCEDALLRDIAV